MANNKRPWMVFRFYEGCMVGNVREFHIPYQRIAITLIIALGLVLALHPNLDMSQILYIMSSTMEMLK